jgi:hypothetical protein
MQRPAFIDADGKRYETANAGTEGWMTKQSAWLKDWRRRFFILKGSKLFFAKGELSAPHGMIDLSTCMTVKSAELKAGIYPLSIYIIYLSNYLIFSILLSITL